MYKSLIPLALLLLISCSAPAPSTATAPETALSEDAIPQKNRAETIMKAFLKAYPDRIKSVEKRDNDWALNMDGIWFYYAEGRLLREKDRASWKDYDPQPFYSYVKELPPWQDSDPSDSQRLKAMTEERRAKPPKRSQDFYDTLWRAHNKNEAYERVKTIRFLGHETLVHYSIMEELALVEEAIRKAAQENPEVQTWIEDQQSITAWNWRSIADTQSRSYHSYGAALDILPKKSGGLVSYWLWAAESNQEWWNIPYDKRQHPPKEVISAFESQGFIWGGKWRLYDTMHFEYRPEILILNGML